MVVICRRLDARRLSRRARRVSIDDDVDAGRSLARDANANDDFIENGAATCDDAESKIVKVG